MGRVFFISGIDTDVGKTIATGLMARWLIQNGVRAITVKLVQTGCVGTSEDRDKHRVLMGGVSFPEDAEGLTAPEIFSFPASPHLAAHLDGRPLNPAHIASCVRTLEERYDVVLAEGAGGLAVPLTDDLLTVDFAAENRWPVILVTSGKLGSLNHTILSMEALHSRGMHLSGVVYNYCPSADPLIDKDSPEMTLRYLARFGWPRNLVRIPRVESFANPPNLDFAPIFSDGGVRP